MNILSRHKQGAACHAWITDAYIGIIYKIRILARNFGYDFVVNMSGDLGSPG